MTAKSNRAISFLWMFLAYALTFAIAATYIYFFESDRIWLDVLIADVIGTVVIYIIGVVFRNSSFYDPYWSMAPIVIACYFFYLYHNPKHVTQEGLIVQEIVLAAVTFWGIRLTYNFLSGWPGIVHEDWRYQDLREKHGKMFQAVNFSGIHLFPTILVYLGCLPLISSIGENRQVLNWLHFAALAIFLIGIFFETLGDIQLRQFVKKKKSQEEILQTGLWSITRHPNYFGEIMFWWSMALFGTAAQGFHWWHYAGAVSITLLFFFISVPLIETRMLEKRPHYSDVQRRVSMIVPWFPKK